MSHLYTVRHAQVQIDPAIPPHEWHLSAEGQASIAELSAKESWEGVSVIWHSPEPKAEQTARVIAERAGLEMRMHPDLRELAMETGFLSPEEFQARVAAYFSGAQEPDFEPYEDAKKRIVTCVHEIVAAAKGQSVAIVTHGRILNVLYSHLLGRRLGIGEWKSIKLPDLSVVDTKTWRVERGFLAGEESI
jgi:broad specificity phosphatase PhoE